MSRILDAITRSDHGAAIDYLRRPSTIRHCAQQIYALAEQDKLAHFRLRPDRLAETVSYVEAVIRTNYPDLKIPYHSRWRHFNAGGVDRKAGLDQDLASLSLDERGRALVELAIVSVLLDAGAGPQWSYFEPASGQTFTRSEGLAVASLAMFKVGAFSKKHTPWEADAHGLIGLSLEALKAGMQASDAKPLVGLADRLEVLKTLGRRITNSEGFFGAGTNPRLGGLFDYYHRTAKTNGLTLTGADVLKGVLDSLSVIWPGEVLVGATPMGDVWRHPQVHGPYGTDGLIPFHKLAQWMSYSLIEPLEGAGITVRDLDSLTGLPEYRNGGLLLDSGLIELRDAEQIKTKHAISSPLIVEWRALTVALLDVIGAQLRKKWNLSSTELPLTRVLEGGTWAAGRKIAAEKRPGGGPPLDIFLSGTFF